mgnify:CR=1 FL=1
MMRQAMNTASQRPRRFGWLRVAGLAAATACLLFVAAVNAVPALALSMEDVPVLGRIVEVVTLARFRASSEPQAYGVDIAVPHVQGLADVSLEESLNAQYLAEAEARYAAFMEEIDALAEGELAHKALDAGYEVVVEGDPLLVIRHWVVETMASGAESVDYDTIDTARGLVLTLPGLFRDDAYVETISAYLREEMVARTAPEEGIIYFVAPENEHGFAGIAADQEFYINADHNLVIVFDEYEVAPGFMGVVEFEIPTDLIADLLAGDAYIR